MKRFWDKVIVLDSESCWIWKSSTDGKYGTFSLKNRLIKAHRFSYELSNGKIPEGHDICHKCDNPRCVNPTHLFLGTRLDNVRDMIKKIDANPVKVKIIGIQN